MEKIVESHGVDPEFTTAIFADNAAIFLFREIGLPVDEWGEREFWRNAQKYFEENPDKLDKLKSILGIKTKSPEEIEEEVKEMRRQIELRKSHDSTSWKSYI